VLSETEKSILAIIMDRGELGHLVFDNLDRSYFHGPSADVFTAIQELYEDGMDFKWSTVKDHLGSKFNALFWQGLMDSTRGIHFSGAEAFLKEKVRALKTEYGKRKIIAEINQVAGKGTLEESDVDHLDATIHQMRLIGRPKETAGLADAMMAYQEHIRQEESEITTGFPALDRRIDGFTEGELVTIMARAGVGKCHAKGTRVIMADGSFKNVEAIVPGDMVMGIESKSRRVLRCGGGYGPLYKIDPSYGDGFVVNGEHILSLRRTGEHLRSGRDAKGRERWKMPGSWRKYVGGKIVNISVAEYLNKSDRFKQSHKLYRVPIDFAPAAVPIEPYFVGAWLGDGCSYHQQITNQDPELVAYLRGYAERLGYSLTATKQINRTAGWKIVNPERRGIRGGHNTVLDKLRGLGLLHNKHIPVSYLRNSREVRLQLLAGLLDTDGDRHVNSYVFSNTNERLVDDVLYLCRSLGLTAYKNRRISKTNFSERCISYRIFIGGKTWEIPLKISRKRVGVNSRVRQYYGNIGFKITDAGQGDYYGFELDGDGLYLLDSFIVNHNTFFALNIINHLASKIPFKMALFSLEMPKAAIIERMLEVYFGLSRYELKARALDGTLEADEFETRFAKLSIYDKIYSVSELRKIVERESYRVVFIDFLHLVRPEVIGNPYQQISQVIAHLKQMAKDLSCVAFLFHQLSRQAGSGWTPVEAAHARDSGQIEELSDFLIGVSAPGLNPDAPAELGNTLRIRLLKNKRGERWTFDAYFEKSCGRITEEEKERETEEGHRLFGRHDGKGRE